jgi:hypothetical protein
VPGGRRLDHEGGLFGLPGACSSTDPASWADGSDGQPLSSHKGERVRELIESRGCELIYLPPYSPDFNPIEEAFAKLKALVRKAEARSREMLIEAMGWALEALTVRDAHSFFEHRGYRALGQLL